MAVTSTRLFAAELLLLLLLFVHIIQANEACNKGSCVPTNSCCVPENNCKHGGHLDNCGTGMVCCKITNIKRKGDGNKNKNANNGSRYKSLDKKIKQKTTKKQNNNDIKKKNKSTRSKKGNSIRKNTDRKFSGTSGYYFGKRENWNSLANINKNDAKEKKNGRPGSKEKEIGGLRQGMDDCGRNRTCRKQSHECKKLLFTSMVDNYVGDGDDEIVTTMDKMAAMMEMFMEYKNNLTDCANETGIQLPNFDATGSSSNLKRVIEMSGRVGMAHPDYRSQSAVPKGSETHGGEEGVARIARASLSDDWLSRLTGKVYAADGTGSSNSVKKVIAIPGRVGPSVPGRSTFGGKWQHGNFGVTEEDAIELRKCLLGKKLMLNSDGSLNRDSLKVQILPSYSFQAGLQAAVEEAVDACPEPQDYNIVELNKCIIKACIDNLQLDDDDFSLKASRLRTEHYYVATRPRRSPILS